MSVTVICLTGAAGVLVTWYVITLLIALNSRPGPLVPGPPTMELGYEPPAVVNLLVNRGEVTQAAADATLLDLAARRILELHQPGSDPADLLVRVRVPDPAGLSSYERQVFDRVAAGAANRLVPLTQVTQRYAEGGPEWFGQLRARIAEDARHRGLLHKKYMGSAPVIISVVGGMALGCLGILPFQGPDGSHLSGAVAFLTAGLWFVLSPVIALVLMLIAQRHFRIARLTPQGYAAGGYWLGVGRWIAAHEDLADLPPAAVAVWDRYLAYGLALGLNQAADDQLDLRTGRTAEFVSTYVGGPRRVIARYPRGPFAYTQAGARITWCLIVFAVWVPVLVFAATHLHGPGRGTLYAIGGLILLRSAYRLVRAILARAYRVTATGLVLAAHAWRPAPAGGQRWIQVVVDDGRHDTVRPWLLRADRAGDVRAGDVVTLTAQPWTRFGYTLEVHTRRPRAAVGRSAVADVLKRMRTRPPQYDG